MWNATIVSFGSLSYARRCSGCRGPPVEQVDVVAAVHARADPQGGRAVGALHVQVAHGNLLRRVPGEVEELREERQRGDDAGADVLLPGVLAPQLDLGVAVLVDAGAVGDDVGSAAGAAPEIAGDADATVGAELEAAGRQLVLLGLVLLEVFDLGLRQRPVVESIGGSDRGGRGVGAGGDGWCSRVRFLREGRGGGRDRGEQHGYTDGEGSSHDALSATRSHAAICHDS